MKDHSTSSKPHHPHTANLTSLTRNTLCLAIAASLACASPTHATVLQHGGEPIGPAVQPAAVDQMQTVEIANPTGTDPLTPSEMTIAKRVSADSPQLKAQQALASHALYPSHTAALTDVQFLFAERHDENKSAPTDVRRADVYYYDYANDEVLHQVINVQTGQVEEAYTQQGQQPAVTNIEATAAVQLILDHPQLGFTLRQLHRRASGHDLDTATDVAAQGGIFFADSAIGTPLEKITGICKFHRCVQLFLPYDDTHFIDASNLVVDLSAGQLLWVDEALTAYINTTPVNAKITVYLPIVAR